jgi:hypothetical protein
MESDGGGEDATESETWDNWQDHTLAIRDSLGMPHDYKPWTSHARLLGCPDSARCRDIIDVGYFAYQKTLQSSMPTPKEIRWVVDISQGVERKPWSHEPATLFQGSQLYSYSLDRVLDGEDWL